MTRPMTQTSPAMDVRALLDAMIANAVGRGVSDIHVEPGAEACEFRFREDGILRTEMAVSAEVGRSAALRLMVLAHLLTYRLDVPQEGRASVHHAGREAELRISVMPTIHGLRVAVRLPASAAPQELEQLGLDQAILHQLYRFARAETGVLIITGPAGSGKTTTIYALLSYLAARSSGTSIVALEDPVERAIAGVTQIEVKPFGQLTYEKALRSILRQDPQILMLGEIRDVATAQLALQAAMTGHRLITTLHAGSSVGAITRLLEMGLEPYQITNSVWGVLAQRLVRKIPRVRETLGTTPSATALDKRGSVESEDAHPNPLPEYQARGSIAKKREDERDGASKIYSGRTAVGELLLLDANLRRVIFERPDVDRLSDAAAMQTGFMPLRQAAQRLIQNGLTDGNEVSRIFGEGT